MTTTPTFTSPSPTSPTNFTNNSFVLTPEQLDNEYSWFEIKTNDYTADIFENIYIALAEFLWKNLKLIGLENAIEALPLYVRATRINMFGFLKPRFLEGCFKLPNPNPFVRTDIVTHECIHQVFKHCNPLGEEAMGRAIEETICDIVGVIFNQTYTMNYNNWSIGGLRDLSKEKFDDGTLKHAISFEPPLGASSKNNDIALRNSQILSRCFYLASKELSHTIYARRLLLMIWFNSVMLLKPEEKTYVGLRKKTIELASSLNWKPLEDAVTNAWNQISYMY